MALAGAFLGLGIIMFGSRVIETIGKNLTVLDYHISFCIEFSSCVTVVLATLMKLPVSTTHCQIGSVVLVGLFVNGKDNVKWSLFGRIVLTWLFTIPFSGAISTIILEITKFWITQ